VALLFDEWLNEEEGIPL
jgi:hypothetical protein